MYVLQRVGAYVQSKYWSFISETLNLLKAFLKTIKTGRTSDLTHNPNWQYFSEFQVGGLCFRTSSIREAETEQDWPLLLSFSWTIQRQRSCHCSFEFWQQMGQRFLSPDARLSACCRAQTPTESLCREQPSCRLCYLFKTIFTEQWFSYLAEI